MDATGNKRAAGVFQCVINEIKSRGAAKPETQKLLRKAYAANMQDFLKSVNRMTREVREREQSIQRSWALSNSRVDYAATMNNSISDEGNDDSKMAWLYEHISLQPYQILEE